MKVYYAFFIFLFPLSLSSQHLYMRDGSEREIKIKRIDGKKIYAEEGEFNMDDISMISFKEESKKDERKNISQELIERGKNLFEQVRFMKEKYPDSEAIIINDLGKERYNEDGTTESEYEYSVLILKEEAKKRYDRVITYETQGRSVSDIVYANVFCPGNIVYPFEPSKIKTTEPQSAEKFFYAGGRYKVYQVEGLDVGCILDYKIKSRLYNPYKKEFFFPQWSFQTTNPVVRSRIEITVPKKIELIYSAKNFKGEFEKNAIPAIEQDGETKTYIWDVENIPPIVEEPYMPPIGDVAMYLYASVLKDWDMIFDWTGKLYRERSKPGEKLREFTLDLIKGLKSDEEKVARIYHYVQKEIRYIAVKVGIGSGIGGYDANLTWERKWGCCIDKALLMTAMLSAAGIKSSPVLIATNNTPKFPTNVPGFYFDHAITVVYLGNKKVFLDSTNYDYRYPQIASFNYGVNVLDIFNRTIDFIPLPQPKENAGFYDYKIELFNDGRIEVINRMRYSGSREAEVRGYYKGKKGLERVYAFEKVIKDVSPNARLITYTTVEPERLDKPYEMEINYEVREYTDRAKDIIIFKIPDFKIPDFELLDISLSDRKYPIERSVNSSRYYTYTIKIPQDVEIISLPKFIEIKSKHIDFSAGCSHEECMINCYKNFERKTRVVPVEDYEEYKDTMKRIVKYCEENIYFREVVK